MLVHDEDFGNRRSVLTPSTIVILHFNDERFQNTHRVLSQMSKCRSRRAKQLKYKSISVLLHPGDKEDPPGTARGKPVEVVVAAVEDHDAFRLVAQGGADAAFVRVVLSDDGVAGQRSFMIEQQMQLHCSHRAPMLRPVEECGAQRDQSRAEGVELVFESEAMVAGGMTAVGQQLIEHALVQLPSSIFFGMARGQGVCVSGQILQLTDAGGVPT